VTEGSFVLAELGLLKRFGAVLNVRTRLPVDDITQAPPTYRDRLISGLLMARSKDRGLILLQPNRAQQEYSRKCTRRNIVLKARQLGITTYIAARFFIQTITQPGSMTVQVAHNQESAEEIFKIVHRFWENLRDGTREGALMTSHDNVRQMVFPRLDSEYRVASAADLNAGRGLTIHNLHCSEVARWPRAGIEALTSLRAAVPPDGDIVLESTPNGAGGVFYEEWEQADETGYTRHFFPWWYDDHYVVDPSRIALYPLTPEEEELVKRAGLTAQQIAWRRINRAQLRGLAAQEYAEDPISCFRASGECVFDLDVIDRILSATGEPLEMSDNRRLMIWLPPQRGKEYIIGVDPAGGGSDGDYCCAEVIERKTGMQCAELHGHFPPGELADRLAHLATKYNHALLVVERNNHGHAVLQRLRSLGYDEIYCEGRREGWLTSAASRPAMIENLAAVLAAEPLQFRSPRLLRECRTFVRHADGRPEAASGAHDDCVMAMAIALAARQAEAGKVWHDPAVDLISLPALSEHP
jgi:hypothetical protein